MTDDTERERLEAILFTTDGRGPKAKREAFDQLLILDRGGEEDRKRDLAVSRIPELIACLQKDFDALLAHPPAQPEEDNA